MFICCRYKSTVTELITLQILHCTPSFNIFISYCPDFCVLQIQIYSYESNHRSGIILSYGVSSCISFNDHNIEECVRVNFMLFILCIFLHSMFYTNKMHWLKYNKTGHKTQFMLGAYYTFRHQGAIFRRFIKNKGCLVQHIFEVLVSLTSIINIKSVEMLKFPLDHILVQMFVHTTH